MAEIFENTIEFMPDWANENIEDDLVKAVDKYEEQQKIKKTKSRFANVKTSELSQILEQSQSSATKRNTKWVVNLFEGEFLYTKQLRNSSKLQKSILKTDYFSYTFLQTGVVKET